MYHQRRRGRRSNVQTTSLELGWRSVVEDLLWVPEHATDIRAGVPRHTKVGHADTAHAVISEEVELDSQSQWH